MNINSVNGTLSTCQMPALNQAKENIQSVTDFRCVQFGAS